MDPKFKLSWCNDEPESKKTHISLIKDKVKEMIHSRPHQNETWEWWLFWLFAFYKNNTSETISEVEKYLSVDWYMMDNDPILYWKVNEQRLPFLSKLDITFLNTPVSSATVWESFFHFLKNIQTRKMILKWLNVRRYNDI